MSKDNKWAEELEKIASVLNKSGLEKAVKWGAEVFTYKGRNVVSYGGFKHYCTLWFYNGVFLKDTYKVLVNAQEGKTKSLRQWRFTDMDQIDEKKILEYVREAIRIEEKGLKIQPQKFQPVPVPDLLNAALTKNKQLKAAFDRLTPGKQKEYIVYLIEAKQERTRLNRLEKIIPMVLEGIGLNDRYK